MIKMKCLIYILLISTISSACSAGSSKDVDSLLIKRNDAFTACDNYFIVSPYLEPDIKYRNILGAYIYKSLVDVYDCECLNDGVLNVLYNKESFVKTIMLFYNDERYVELSHFEKDYRWKENHDNLLRNCSDLNLLHKIADTLLTYNKSNGITVLWNNLDLEKLNHIDNYITYVIDKDNMFKLSEIVIIFHNIKEFEKRDFYLKIIESMEGFTEEYKKILSLIEQESLISHELYIETIFGGY